MPTPIRLRFRFHAVDDGGVSKSSISTTSATTSTTSSSAAPAAAASNNHYYPNPNPNYYYRIPAPSAPWGGSSKPPIQPSNGALTTSNAAKADIKFYRR